MKIIEKDIGLVPMIGNPATRQIIFHGRKNQEQKPFGAEPVQLSIPFNNDEDKVDLYCNGCEFLKRIQRPLQGNHNCRCTYSDDIAGGRIIQLKVYIGEKIKKPFWCPIIKNKIMNGTDKSKLILPARKQSAMSDEQLENWKKSRQERLEREKWLSIPGLTAWSELQIGKTYHMPPMHKKGRMDLYIVTKYMDSIMAYKKGTKERVWLYKQDEEYKFMTPLD